MLIDILVSLHILQLLLLRGVLQHCLKGLFQICILINLCKKVVIPLLIGSVHNVLCMVTIVRHITDIVVGGQIIIMMPHQLFIAYIFSKRLIFFQILTILILSTLSLLNCFCSILDLEIASRTLLFCLLGFRLIFLRPLRFCKLSRDDLFL